MIQNPEYKKATEKDSLTPASLVPMLHGSMLGTHLEFLQHTQADTSREL